MTEIHVQRRPMDKGAPVALRDTPETWDLAIDQDQITSEVADALQALLQEAVDSGRWQRIGVKPEP